MGVSVVIIGRNEARNLSRCIESVFSALLDQDNYEIIYVDSNSEDESVSIALSHGVKVVRILNADPFCAALGRHIGASLCQNEYIMFLDGDMELTEGWIEAGIKNIESSQEFVGAKGILDEYRLDDEDSCVSFRENVNEVFEYGIARYFGGAILLKKCDLIQAGNWSRGVIANEEAELYSRIKQKGQKVIQLPIKMATHYRLVEKNDIKHRVRLIFNKRHLGIGQGFVNSLLTKSHFSFIRHFKFFFFSFLMDILCIILVTGAWFRGTRLFFLAILIQLGLFTLNVVNRKWYWYILDKITGVYFIPGMLTYKQNSVFQFDVISSRDG